MGEQRGTQPPQARYSLEGALPSSSARATRTVAASATPTTRETTAALPSSSTPNSNVQCIKPPLGSSGGIAAATSGLDAMAASLQDKKLRLYQEAAAAREARKLSSAGGVGGSPRSDSGSRASTSSGSGRAPRQQQPTQRRQAVKHQVDSAFQQRLQAQLGALSSAADDVKRALAPDCDSSPPLGQAMARGCVVGATSSSSSTTVRAYEDRLEYDFHHPQRGPIKMVMKYKDMQQAVLDVPNMRLTFRVSRELRHFTSEYDPANARHELSLQLCSYSDAGQLRTYMDGRAKGLSVRGLL